MCEVQPTCRQMEGGRVRGMQVEVETKTARSEIIPTMCCPSGRNSVRCLRHLAAIRFQEFFLARTAPVSTVPLVALTLRLGFAFGSLCGAPVCPWWAPVLGCHAEIHKASRGRPFGFPSARSMASSSSSSSSSSGSSNSS